MDQIISAEPVQLLVVDDDDNDREMILGMLLASGLNAVIDEEQDADNALDRIDKVDYDCVIIDYSPGLCDGLLLLKAIRENLNKHCSVIMVTALGDESVAAEAMRLGANDYLIKTALCAEQLARSVSASVRRSKHAESIHELAHYDSLTGLVSRHLLMDRLQHMIDNARRSKKLSAVAFIDLDNFKPVNDNYGHEAGDNVLVQVANRLKQSLRTNDTIARIGGDEFVILLEEIDSADHCEDLLRRILLILNVPLLLACRSSVRISGSIGVALLCLDDLSADEALRRADQAMYMAKKEGRNQIFFFDPEEEEKQKERRNLLIEVEQGIDLEQFTLYFQPIVNLLDGSLCGVEALVRWDHPEKGLLEPGRFREALDHSTIGVSMGEWVLKQALAERIKMQDVPPDCVISVNISAHHLQSVGFVDSIRSLINEVAGAHPQMLQIEVQETASIKDMDAVVQILHDCKALGVGIALDDFGTGHASLSYLKKLPLDTLKIDQSFVHNFLSDAEDRAIVETIIALSRAFDFSLIAEGVESDEHIEELTRMGCLTGQGFNIALPMAPADLTRWLENKANLSRMLNSSVDID